MGRLYCKISDKISYLGRDIEDALRYGILTDSDIEELNQRLGFYKFGYETLNNTNIINYLNGDLLKNSSIEKGLTFSDQRIKPYKRDKKFNYEKIYKNEKIELGEEYFRIVINTIYNILKEVYDNKIDKIIENPKSKLYKEVVEEFAYWFTRFFALNMTVWTIRAGSLRTINYTI